jgi:hypothetical protein
MINTIFNAYSEIIDLLLKIYCLMSIDLNMIIGIGKVLRILFQWVVANVIFELIFITQGAGEVER